jgi:Uma2 family endonuclease
MADIALKRATYADIEALPEGVVGEILYGALHTQPRPTAGHGLAGSNLGVEIGGPFGRARGGGPGGWVILDEPELHLGTHVVVPDMAGWRRERYDTPPTTHIHTTAPDWVCEIVSPSTGHVDRGPKRLVYAEAGVPHYWIVDPVARTLEAFKLTKDGWLLAAVVTGDSDVQVAPFDAISFPLKALWPFDDANAPS